MLGVGNGDGVGWSRYGSIVQHQSLSAPGVRIQDVRVSFKTTGICITRGIPLPGHLGGTWPLSRLSTDHHKIGILIFLGSLSWSSSSGLARGRTGCIAGITANGTASRLRNDVTGSLPCWEAQPPTLPRTGYISSPSIPAFQIFLGPLYGGHGRDRQVPGQKCQNFYIFSPSGPFDPYCSC